MNRGEWSPIKPWVRRELIFSQGALKRTTCQWAVTLVTFQGRHLSTQRLFLNPWTEVCWSFKGMVTMKKMALRTIGKRRVCMERKVICACKRKQHESFGACCDWSCRAASPLTIPKAIHDSSWGISMELPIQLLIMTPSSLQTEACSWMYTAAGEKLEIHNQLTSSSLHEPFLIWFPTVIRSICYWFFALVLKNLWWRILYCSSVLEVITSKSYESFFLFK